MQKFDEENLTNSKQFVKVFFPVNAFPMKPTINSQIFAYQTFVFATFVRFLLHLIFVHYTSVRSLEIMLPSKLLWPPTHLK